MHKFVVAPLLVTAMMTGGAAHAQSWSVTIGQGPAWQGYARPTPADWDDWRGQRQAGWICSGERAHRLEDRLRHEVDEGDIDPDTAARMHGAIDSLEDRQRHECAEGDWPSVARIGWRYDRIEGWMNAEAQRSHWRGW